MRRKGSNSTLLCNMFPQMGIPVAAISLCLFLFSPVVLVEAGGSSTPNSLNTVASGNTVTSDSATCQCGVFLLGTGTLSFSADAKPVLAGLPVAANCSASDDRISCATICRQLIQAMSGNQENTPLVQTVVLAATRTLACQRFNESHKVPAPRNFEGTHRQTLAQLDEGNKWKFFVGPSSHGARSDLAAERNNAAGSSATVNNNADAEEEVNNAGLTEPKWLGGYYRWCDEHWIYGGVSLHEPLCCQGHVPKKCPNYQPEETSTKKSARNGRQPRLIVIKRCPNNVCEDDDEDLDPSSGESINNNKVSPTSLTRPSLDDEDETEAPETSDKDDDNENDTDDEQTLKDQDNDDGSSETINPYTTPSPVPAKPLNATVMSEALKFFQTLMEGMGYGEIFEGVRSVLPETSAVQLLDRVNHGGWLTHYQDRYMKWPREFSLGYCYLEYSMYNVKNEGGIVPATQNLLERVFGPDRPMTPIGARLPQPPQAPQAMPSQNPYENGLAAELNNYIQPIPQLPGNAFAGYEQYDHSRIPGNRRVRRGVSVSRSYSGPTGLSEARSANSSSGRVQRRRNSVRRVKPQSRTVPLPVATGYDAETLQQVFQHRSSAPVNPETPSQSSRQYIPLHTIQPASQDQGQGQSRQQTSEANHLNNHQRQTSFVPTHTETSKVQERFSQMFPKVYRNNVPYNFDNYQQSPPSRRSHVESGGSYGHGHHGSSSNSGSNVNLAEIARPRRHPGPGGEEIIDDARRHQYSSGGVGRGPPPMLHQAQRKQSPPPTPKDGPSAGNILNIANMLMQTAMASGGNGDGDKVTNIMQTAIPLVTQAANNPAVQGMMNNLVTMFFTPPNSKPPPPPPQRPSEPEDSWETGSISNKRPVNSKNPMKDSYELSSNEIDEPEMSSSSTKPINSRPPPQGGGGGGGGATELFASMVQNMISSYLKHLLSPGPGKPQRPPSSRPGSLSSSNNQKIGDDKPSNDDNKESSDIVDIIANAAKPFFISTFGVVPGDPGYGRLLNRRRDEFKRNGGTSKGHNPNDILTEDPDPGTGIFDILVGPPHFPDTGNKLYDLGNRVVYGFTNANDPHHGVYCFKQYFVNKVWDYFRMGVRAVFK